MGKKKERKKEITYRKMVVILFHLSSQVKGRFGWERSLEWLLRETDGIHHSRNAAKRQCCMVKK